MWWIEVIKVAGMILGAAVTGWFAAWATRKAAATNEAARQDSKLDRSFDQLQEENQRLALRISVLERHERIRDDYIMQLRQHIATGQPPPPPAFPNYRLVQGDS